MLVVEDLRGGWGTADVLHGVGLHVERGEAVAVLGPNGAGKSTLMAALTATLPRVSGIVRLDSRDIARAASRARVAAGLVLVPEARQIFAPFTVRDNLRLGGLRLARDRHFAERLDYVLGLFPQLRDRLGQIAGTLSGGEQQMLAIGRGLMSAPRMLLLDEPFLGLAPRVVQGILAALQRLRADGLTLLIVEQKLDIALGCTSRAYLMLQGRIRDLGCSDALAQRADLHELYFADPS